MKLICEHCKEPFENAAKKKFCSRPCEDAGIHRQVVCKDCDVEFTYHGRGRCVRCPACREIWNKRTIAKWQSKNRTKNPGVGSGGAQFGTDNHQYKHGKCDYKGNHRLLCLKNHEEVCVFCGSTSNVDVHHRDGDQTRCTKDNLVPLCRSCHKKVHYAIVRATPAEVYIEAFELIEAEIKSRN